MSLCAWNGCGPAAFAFALGMALNLGGGVCFAESVKEDSAALDWQSLWEINPYAGSGYESYKMALERYGEGVELSMWKEAQLLEFRKAGLELWRKYPDDPRRFDWLMSTLSSPPHYWVDARKGVELVGSSTFSEVDELALTAWNRELSALRVEANAAPHASLMKAELQNDIMMLTYAKSKGQFVSVDLLIENALRYCAREDVSKSNKVRLVWNLFTSYWHMMPMVRGVNVIDDPALESAFVKALKSSPNSDAKGIGLGFERFFAHRQKPMELSTASMGGGEFDLAKYHGKVVLIDVWSIGCKGCVLAMPYLQALYEEYREQGFEVVGLFRLTGKDEVLNEKEWNMARRAIAEKNARYSQAVIHAGGRALVHKGAKVNGEFANRYAFLGDPTMFFLDRSGRLVSLEASKSQLESEIRKLLGLPPVAHSGELSVRGASVR